MLFGGALPKGKTVEADWPGLAPGALYEGRDLKPTARLEDVASSALAAHYGLAANRVSQVLAV